MSQRDDPSRLMLLSGHLIKTKTPLGDRFCVLENLPKRDIHIIREDIGVAGIGVSSGVLPSDMPIVRASISDPNPFRLA